MIKLEIVEKDKYLYNLQDEDGNKYTINLEFLHTKRQPEIKEFIYINKELLNPKYEGYSTNYTFGNLENKYGKKNITIDDIDVIKVVIDHIEIYLKRLYG